MSDIEMLQVSSPFEDLSDIGSSRVDGLPMMPQDPYSYVEAALQALPSPDYVPGPEHPHTPEFVLEHVYPEHPLPAAVSPTVDSPGYILESDPEEDPKEDPEGDNEDPEEEEEEEHPALADFILPPVYHTTARISIPVQAPVPFLSEAEVERLLALPTPPLSPLSSLSSRLPHILSPLHQILSSPLPI
nr:hypothetical protein [Tanacetum cinerariifolium]